MDLKEKIEQVVEACTKNSEIKELFAKEPVKAIEKVLGVDLPDDIIEKIIDGVKAKIDLDKVSGFLDGLKKFF